MASPMLPHELKRYEEETRTIQIANYRSLVDMLKDIGDNKDMTVLKSHINTMLDTYSTESTVPIVEDKVSMSLTDRLAKNYGLVGRTFDKMCINLGKAVKHQYKLIHRGDPPQRVYKINGNMRFVNIYTESDYEHFIDKFIEDLFADWLD